MARALGRGKPLVQTYSPWEASAAWDSWERSWAPQLAYEGFSSCHCPSEGWDQQKPKTGLNLRAVSSLFFPLHVQA